MPAAIDIKILNTVPLTYEPSTLYFVATGDVDIFDLYISTSNGSAIKSVVTRQMMLDLIDDKQDILISGDNIKTINNQSVLGAGNIDIEAGSGLSIGSEPPSSPNVGDQWLCTNDGNIYLYYNDGTNSQWIGINGNGERTISSPPSSWKGGVLVALTLSGTVTQSIAHNVQTVISWGGEKYDTANMWSAGNPTQIIIPSGVTKVRIGASTRFESGGNMAFRSIFTSINNNNFTGRAMSLLYSTENVDLHCWTPVVSVAPGDIIRALVFHQAGSSRNITDTDGFRTWLAVEIIE